MVMPPNFSVRACERASRRDPSERRRRRLTTRSAVGYGWWLAGRTRSGYLSLADLLTSSSPRMPVVRGFFSFFGSRFEAALCTSRFRVQPLLVTPDRRSADISDWLGQNADGPQAIDLAFGVVPALGQGQPGPAQHRWRLAASAARQLHVVLRCIRIIAVAAAAMAPRCWGGRRPPHQTRTSSLGAARPLPPSADIGPGGQSVGQAAQFCLAAPTSAAGAVPARRGRRAAARHERHQATAASRSCAAGRPASATTG